MRCSSERSLFCVHSESHIILWGGVAPALWVGDGRRERFLPRSWWERFPHLTFASLSRSSPRRTKDFPTQDSPTAMLTVLMHSYFFSFFFYGLTPG